VRTRTTHGNLKRAYSGKQILAVLKANRALSCNDSDHFLHCGPMRGLDDEEVKVTLLCKICGFHGGEYEDCRLLRCDALWLW
jgi:hypothetical protein